MIRLEDCDSVIDHTPKSFSAYMNNTSLTMQKPKPDPFAKIAKAISGGMAGKFSPTSADMLGMVTKKQWKVPKGTTITVPRRNAVLPVDRRDVAAGEMIITQKVAIYEEEELLPGDFENSYIFKLPFNSKEIPYILVDHKRTTVVYIIELPGDLNEQIF